MTDATPITSIVTTESDADSISILIDRNGIKTSIWLTKEESVSVYYQIDDYLFPPEDAA